MIEYVRAWLAWWRGMVPMRRFGYMFLAAGLVLILLASVLDAYRIYAQ